MAPSILNFRALRRRSKASFKTDRSNTDVSSEASNTTTPTPTSGASTPPSIAQASDPALDLQLKDSNHPAARLPLPTVPNSHRNSVSGMAGLGSPINGKSTLPVSPYAPRIANITENAWVSKPYVCMDRVRCRAAIVSSPSLADSAKLWLRQSAATAVDI